MDIRSNPRPRPSAPLVVAWVSLVLAILLAILQFVLPIPSTRGWDRALILAYGGFMFALPLVVFAGLMYALFGRDRDGASNGRLKGILLWNAALVLVISYIAFDENPLQALILLVALVWVSYNVSTVISIVRNRWRRNSAAADMATESPADEDPRI